MAAASRPQWPAAFATILIVEDEENVREGLLMLLEIDAQRVVVAVNAAEAAGIILTSIQPDLILLDIDLPDRPGTWIYALARKSWPDVAVIAMSGNATADVLPPHPRLRFLRKPFTYETLIERARELCPA